jgi:ribosome-binding factor A
VSRGKPGGRRERVAEAMKSELSELIAREVKDPRVSAALPAIGSVVVNKDLNVAEVGVSFLIDNARLIADAMKGLEAAAGFLRGPLARRLNLPFAPELRFHHDKSQELGMKLHNIVREDQARRREADMDDRDPPGPEADESLPVVDEPAADPGAAAAPSNTTGKTSPPASGGVAPAESGDG